MDGAPDEQPPIPLGGRQLTHAERAWLGDLRRAAVRGLLGGVGELLTGELGGWADWAHLWIGAGGDTGRFEWAGGPPMAAVVDLLQPRIEDGDLRGLAGLRLLRVDDRAATFDWIAHPGTSLHLTRLRPDGAGKAFSRELRQRFDAAYATYS